MAISDSLQAFDPLDRDVPKKENQAIKRKDLLDRLKNLKPIEGKNL